MMLPMLRSEVFVILSDIFCQKDNRKKTPLGNITMSESVGNPYDIDFRCEYTGTIVGYLRIVNPPKDCVDGEYCFVYHVPKTQEAGNIAIDSFGNIRVYGDDIDSFIYKAIKDNANRLADLSKKLTLTYQNQVADTIVSAVKTYCETLMNEHASDFDQMDISVSEGVCTEFLIRSINKPERNCQFDVVKHIYECDIINNDIWVRFSKPDGWLWTPLVIKPSIGDIVINTEQCVFTNIFGANEVVRLARLISGRTGFEISVGDGSSTRDKNVVKYIKSLLQKHEVIDTVKQVSTEKDEHIGCDEVFQVVVDWLHAMCSCNRIKDVRNVCQWHLSVSNSVGCGASKQYVTKELKVSYTPYMKSIMISLGKEHIITIDYLGLGDKSTCVYILKYNQSRIDDVLNKYLVACLAKVLKDRLGMDKLRAYTAVKCTQYTELTHCGRCFFTDDGMTAYAIDPEFVISKEKIDKMNDENNKTFEQLIDSTIDKKIARFCDVAERSAYYTTKEYQFSNICKQLTLWQQGIFHMIYAVIYCTLAESKYTGAAYELERHFVRLVGTDKDQGFHVYIRLDNIHKDLPRFDIEFDQSDVFVRIQQGDFTKTCVLLSRETDHATVYTQNIKYMRDTYKTIVSHVVSKIILAEVLS